MGLGRGIGDTQSLPGPGAGAGQALFNLQVQYSLKFGILEPFWELWEGLPVKETPPVKGSPTAPLNQGTKSGRGRERGKKPKLFPTFSSPKSQGSRGICSQGHLIPQHSGPLSCYSQGLEC